MVGVDLVTRLSDGHAVAALRGELDISGSADAASAIAALAARGRVVIVDLSELDFLDCASLGALLKVRALARQAGSDVWLAAPRPIVQRLLMLSGIGEGFIVHGSVDAAVTSMGLSPGRYGSYRPAVSSVPVRGQRRCLVIPGDRGPNSRVSGGTLAAGFLPK